MKRLLTWKTAIWLAMAALVLWIWRPFSPSTEEWDRRIEAMCAERWAPDKAYKVYVTEKIVPPKSYFTSDMAHFNGPKPDDEISRRDLAENPLIWQMTELEVINERRPRVSAYAIQHVRQADRKVVGESYVIIRAGTANLFDVGYLNRKLCRTGNSGGAMALELYEGLLPTQVGLGKAFKGDEK